MEPPWLLHTLDTYCFTPSPRCQPLQVFWDRNARVYDQELLLRVAVGDGLPPFRNLQQPQEGLPSSLPHNFSVVSLNVLFDIYDHRCG